MRVDEIIVNPAEMGDEIGNYTKYFNNAPAISVGNGLEIRTNLGSPLSYLGLFRGDEHIAFLAIEDTQPYPTVDMTLTAPGEQNQGWMRLLVKWYVQNHGPLLSSTTQTVKAMWMWKAFLRTPYNLKFYHYDLSTGTKTPLQISQGSVVDPWDDRSDTAILVENRTLPPPSPHSLRRISEWGEGPGSNEFPNP